MALDLSPLDREEDRVIYDSVVQQTDDLRGSPFCEELVGDERIRQLLADRYISNEAVLRRKRRRDNREVGRRGDRRQLPEAPPPPLPAFTLPPLEVIFDEPEFDQLEADVIVADPPIDEGPRPAVHDPEEQFYVRTLTENDVNKLRGNTPGTAEWDIGVTARNVRPGFWGWPDSYGNAVQGLERLEWRAAGSLWSSLTGEAGQGVEIVLWFREARDGHAAEHRLMVRPSRLRKKARRTDAGGWSVK